MARQRAANRAISRAVANARTIGRHLWCNLPHESNIVGLRFADGPRTSMRLLERLMVETEGLHAEADEDAFQLLGAAKPTDYLRFLTRTFGFVLPLERSVVRTPDIDRVIDLRRFAKHQLLRHDLIGFRMHPDQIDELPQCTLPVFDSPEEALGWAFVVERSTLSHDNLFRHLASIMPGDVAYTSTYLKCYLGTVGESWKAFGDALERAAPTAGRAERVIDSAKAAFRVHRTWRRHYEEQQPYANDRVTACSSSADVSSPGRSGDAASASSFGSLQSR